MEELDHWTYSSYNLLLDFSCQVLKSAIISSDEKCWGDPGFIMRVALLKAKWATNEAEPCKGACYHLRFQKENLSWKKQYSRLHFFESDVSRGERG